MGRKLKQTDHSARIYFRLCDEDLWHPKYMKSRTSLINNALAYGLPILIDEEFGQKKIYDEPDEQPTAKSVVPTVSESVSDKRIDQIIVLLQEIVLNTNIDKSLICSLFNIKAEELKGTKVSDKFKRGGFRDTPEYLIKYEIEALNAMDEVD